MVLLTPAKIPISDSFGMIQREIDKEQHIFFSKSNISKTCLWNFRFGSWLILQANSYKGHSKPLKIGASYLRQGTLLEK